MATKQSVPPRTKVRRAVVLLALTKLHSAGERLGGKVRLEQQVYVASHRSPESFGKPTPDGGVLLGFVRVTEFNAWSLDETLVQILEDDN